jgi:hypothetical protein
MNGQTSRILKALLDAEGQEVSAVVLHRIGSGTHLGWCGSLSRRISDIRALGHAVAMRDEWREGRRWTYYTLTPKPQPTTQP